MASCIPFISCAQDLQILGDLRVQQGQKCMAFKAKSLFKQFCSTVLDDRQGLKVTVSKVTQEKSRNKSPQTLSPYGGEQLSHLVSINSQEPTAKGEPIPRLGSGMVLTETTASEQQDR